MPLSWNEIKSRAFAFSREWSDAAHEDAEAKPFLQKAIAIKADYAEAYYLLAMCEFAEMNLKGTKTNLQKYLEHDPAGKHAAEVKAMVVAGNT